MYFLLSETSIFLHRKTRSVFKYQTSSQIDFKIFIILQNLSYPQEIKIEHRNKVCE